MAYATGHAVPIETGPSPFAGGPTLAINTREGAVALVCPNHDARPSPRIDSLHPYLGFGREEPADHVTAFLSAVSDAMAGLGVTGPVAVEAACLPVTLAEQSGARWVRRSLARGRSRRPRSWARLGGPRG